MNKTLLIILGIIVVIGIYFGFTYNRLVTLNENIDGQWAQVETQYQRRFDLIPNLIASVKGTMAQEQKIFGELAEARTRYSGAGSVKEKVSATNQLEGALGRLLVVMENYPTLKSAENVQSLMAQLEGTENRISVERKRFNDETKTYNTLIKRIPANIVASLFNFEEKEYFESAEGSEKAPEVNFN